MADISKITLPSGTTYNIKDAQARSDIADLQTAISGGVTFEGVTTTPLTDGATTNPIIINGSSKTATKGWLVAYDSSEFVFDGEQWFEMGDLSVLGDLAYKDNASASYTPAGTVSQPTFTGSSSAVTISVDPAQSNQGNYTPSGTVSQPTFTGSALVSTGTYTPEGNVSVGTTDHATVEAVVSPVAIGPGESASYTPGGTVSAPTISVATAGSTTTVNSITDVGTLPTLTTTVANENLTIAFSQGTLPTKGSNTTVKTGDASYSASQPSFTGTGVLLTAGVDVPAGFEATFTGTQKSVSVSGTPSGTVSKPTFYGTEVDITGTVTPSGTISQPTFSGTAATITVS